MAASEPPDRPPDVAGETRRTATRRGNPAAPAEVGAMFDRIAGVYDPLNAVISGFQEPRWRRRLVAATRLEPGMSALDVATGTGAVARDLARRVGPAGGVLGIDLSAGMVARARTRPGTPSNLRYELGNALALPVADGTFDAATIAFGMRNLPDYAAGFAEIARAVGPGGVVACLEIARPGSIIGRMGRVWFERIVPAIGRLAGQGEAYRYLVTSVRAYPPPEEIAKIMRSVGLVEVGWVPLTFGMVTLHTGRRA
ncbi:MAG: ubiquinone/menaquinone biosynthesis methyltransferase [Chloroflexi bacterium]|nr:ubiquinone/menaquinone biosynthesis methyltransferase [Chloroflexota bacterium]